MNLDKRKASSVCAVLFAAGALFVLLWIAPAKRLESLEVLHLLVVPLAASAGLGLLSVTCPELLAGRSWKPPQALLLPVVHSLFVLLIASLATTGHTAIQKVPERMEHLYEWVDLRNVGACCVLQIAAMLGIGLMTGRPRGLGESSR